MVKRIYIIIWALAVAIMANAHDVSGYPIGYCNGVYGNSSKIKYDGENVEISAALHIPSSYASTVAGSSIEKIRVALCSKLNVDTVYVWVRESLYEKDIAYGSKPMSDLSQGWNEVDLATPYHVAENTQGFYLGMTYVQKKKSGPVSIIETPRKDALWIKCGKGEWEDLSSEGILCIEGLAYGERLPEHNAEMVSITTNPFFIISDGMLSGAMEVRNLGVETIRELTISMSADGMAENCEATVECMIPYGEVGKVGFSMTPTITERYADKVDGLFIIERINGVEDEDYSDNSGNAEFRLLDHAYPRVALVEEFTTENCPNCPRVAGYIHDLMEDPQYSSRIIPLCHHAGYGNDFLSTSFANEYVWFYNNGGSTYAPATMIDRIPFNEISPLFCPGSVEELASAIDHRLEFPAMVSMEMTSVVTEENIRTIYVSVRGERTDNMNVPDDVRITVMLVENNIKAKNQSGVGGDYYHQHVGREVNSTWGDIIDWDGDSYSYEYLFNVDSSWDTDNIIAIAFISCYDSDDAMNCEVKNAAMCDVIVSGVEEIPDSAKKSLVNIFTIDGRSVDSPVKGLNVFVYSDGSCRKVITR